MEGSPDLLPGRPFPKAGEIPNDVLVNLALSLSEVSGTGVWVSGHGRIVHQLTGPNPYSSIVPDVIDPINPEMPVKKILVSLLLLACGHAYAQTTTTKVMYSCPTASALNGNAKTAAACPAWTWQTVPARTADTPLVAVCASTAACNWNTSGVVTWRRPNQVAVTDRVSVCNPTSAAVVGTRNSCSPEVFELRDTVWPPPPVVNPTATIAASPTSVPYNGSSVLTWSSTNTTACTTTGSWSDSIGTAGAMTITGIRANSTFGIRCTNAAGTAALASASVNAGAAPPPPTLTLTIDKNPIEINGSIQVTWSSTDASSCLTSFPYGPPPAAPALSGANFPVGPFPTIGTYTIRVTCTGILFGSAPIERSISLVVTESSLVPSCWPHWIDWVPVRNGGTGHVAWAPLLTANSNSYDIKATFFCPTPGGPRKYTYALDSSKMVDEGKTEFDGGSYDEDAAREQCRQNCVELPDGSPVLVELDAWRDLPANSLENIGVVGGPAVNQP